MRLFKVMLVPSEPTGTVVEALVPTSEEYKDVDSFIRHAEKNGEKYEGARWRLVARKGPDIDVTVKATTVYKATKTEAKGIEQKQIDLFDTNAA